MKPQFFDFLKYESEEINNIFKKLTNQ